MRAARLIKMVLLLQSHPAMTAAELARELHAAVAENRCVDDDELYRRLGMEKPPPDAEL